MENDTEKFTAAEIIAIIKAGSEANADQLHISGSITLNIKYRATEVFTTEDLTPVTPSHTKADQAPSFDEGSLMITDPMRYEEMVLTED